MMSRDQADALARFLHAIRPEWDHPGIFRALGDARHKNPFDAAVAAIRWTANPECRTPGGMGKPGIHWDERIAPPETYRPPKREEACPLHIANYRDNCAGCEADRKAGDPKPTVTTRPLPPERVKAKASEARAALRVNTDPEETL